MEKEKDFALSCFFIPCKSVLNPGITIFALFNSFLSISIDQMVLSSEKHWLIRHAKSGKISGRKSASLLLLLVCLRAGLSWWVPINMENVQMTLPQLQQYPPVHIRPFQSGIRVIIEEPHTVTPASSNLSWRTFLIKLIMHCHRTLLSFCFAKTYLTDDC